MLVFMESHREADAETNPLSRICSPHSTFGSGDPMGASVLSSLDESIAADCMSRMNQEMNTTVTPRRAAFTAIGNATIGMNWRERPDRLGYTAMARMRKTMSTSHGDIHHTTASGMQC